MKKLAFLSVAIISIFTLAACGSNKNIASTSSKVSTSQNSKKPSTSSVSPLSLDNLSFYQDALNNKLVYFLVPSSSDDSDSLPYGVNSQVVWILIIDHGNITSYKIQDTADNLMSYFATSDISGITISTPEQVQEKLETAMSAPNKTLTPVKSQNNLKVTISNNGYVTFNGNEKIENPGYKFIIGNTPFVISGKTQGIPKSNTTTDVSLSALGDIHYNFYDVQGPTYNGQDGSQINSYQLVTFNK